MFYIYITGFPKKDLLILKQIGRKLVVDDNSIDYKLTSIKYDFYYFLQAKLGTF